MLTKSIIPALIRQSLMSVSALLLELYCYSVIAVVFMLYRVLLMFFIDDKCALHVFQVNRFSLKCILKALYRL